MSDADPNIPRIDRRTALKWISAASATIPFATSAEPAAAGYGPDPNLLKIYNPGDLWPLTFTDAQRKVMITLCDIIIPADDTSPSASAVGVHDFVDEWISSPYPAQKGDRNAILKGLEWLDERNFAALSADEQLSLCQDLAVAAKKDRRKMPGSFFYSLRNLVAGGYYTTPEGMRDIGYRGNVPVAEWNGPPQEVLDRLGLDSFPATG